MNDINVFQHLNSIDEKQKKLAIEKSLLLQKSLASNDVEEIYKAQQYLQKNTALNSKQQSHKSLLVDPFDISSSMGFYQKTSQLSYDLLRAMSRTPLINAIISTRKDQIADFCSPQIDKYSKGFVIQKKSKLKSSHPTDAEKRMIDSLTQFVINCAENENIWDLDDFDSFIRKLVDDSLALDQATFEVVYNRANEPVQFVAIDGGTIRIADSYDNVNNIDSRDKKIDGYYPSYVQIYQGRIVNEYYPWELCFGVRNPSTNINSNNYGKSELEILISTVTSMLNSDAYNAKIFRNGTAPKGALMVKSTGGLNPDKIANLRKEWNAMMSGVENMHKTPILDGEKVEWIDLQKSNRDMEYSKFQEYLIKVSCAVYKISPEEIGFPLNGSHQGLGSKEGGDQEKLYSQSKGLKPLLKSLENWINKFIIGPKTDSQYEFKFVGLDTESSQAEEERLVRAASTYMEVNEIRKIRDLDPLPYGDTILNPMLMQQQMMQKQMQQGGTGQQDQQEEPNPFEKAFKDWWDKEMFK